MNTQETLDIIRTIVKNEIRNAGLLTGQWRLGKVTSVISNKKLMVKVDGSDRAQEVGCNPDCNFSANDEVWVIFINGDAKNKFVISRRAV